MQAERNGVSFILCSVKALFFSSLAMQMSTLRQEDTVHEGAR